MKTSTRVKNSPGASMSAFIDFCVTFTEQIDDDRLLHNSLSGYNNQCISQGGSFTFLKEIRMSRKPKWPLGQHMFDSVE